MRTSFIILAATLLMTAFPAQAQDSERRLLTMEDVILNRELTPKNFAASWIGQSDSYAWVDGTTLCATDARNNKRRTTTQITRRNAGPMQIFHTTDNSRSIPHRNIRAHTF